MLANVVRALADHFATFASIFDGFYDHFSNFLTPQKRSDDELGQHYSPNFAVLPTHGLELVTPVAGVSGS